MHKSYKRSGQPNSSVDGGILTIGIIIGINYWQLMSTGRRATFLWYGDPEGLPITVQRDGLPPYAHTGRTK